MAGGTREYVGISVNKIVSNPIREGLETEKLVDPERLELAGLMAQ